ncbi:MAG: hypothetical protein WC791_01455 [Candidatus Paceibacterota bacterium]|jgi:hypothetical protein
MKNAKVIGIDFDDVIVSTNEAMALWHNRVYGTAYERKDIFTYSIEKIWGCSLDEANKRIDNFFSSDEHTSTKLINAAVDSLRMLKGKDKELHIITARRKEFSPITLLLAQKHIPFLLDSFHFPNGSVYKGIPTKRRKAELCLDLGIEVFIDDHLDYAFDIAATGTPVLLLDAPWNQTAELPKNVTRVYSWEEIVGNLT